MNLESKKITGCAALISLYDTENSAVRSLSAVLRKNKCRTLEIYFKDWVNNKLFWPTNKEIDNLIKILKEEKVNIIGVSLRASAYFKVAKFIITKVKRALDIIVFIGGTHPTVKPRDCLEIADIVCVGEGELVIPELVEKIFQGEDFKNISNLWVKRGETIYKNDVCHLINNLDSLPSPHFSDKDKYFIDGNKIYKKDPILNDPIVSYSASRGCFFNCSFCYNSALKRIYKGKGEVLRYKTVDKVIDELKKIKGSFRKLKKIRFDDEVFIFDKQWMEEFCGKYKRKISLPFECFIYPGEYEEKLWVNLREAGLSAVNVGVEGSPHINKELYNREFLDKTIKDIAEILHKLKIEAHYQIVVDDFISDNTDREYLFNFLMNLPRPFEIYLFSLTVFPGTDLAKKLLAEGYIKDSDIEGISTKTFKQLRVDLGYPRSKEELFWVSLLILISKAFIPKRLIRGFERNLFLKKYPKILAFIAQISNIVKMIGVASLLLVRGEINYRLIKRWVNPRSMITQ